MSYIVIKHIVLPSGQAALLNTRLLLVHTFARFPVFLGENILPLPLLVSLCEKEASGVGYVHFC